MMPSRHTKIARKGIHSFRIKDDLLLFDENTQELILLNSTARVVWEGLQSGIKIDEIVTILSEMAPDESEQILTDINSILSQWKKLGLLRGTRKKKDLTQTVKTRQPDFIGLDFGEKIIRPAVKTHRCHFKLIHTIFRFDAPDHDILNLVRQNVSHLLIDDTDSVDIELSVAKTDRRYRLYKNKTPVDGCSQRIGIVPMVHAMIMMTTYDKTECIIGLHAAAVLKNNACILMPAGSGSGKSTLTAALIQSGFTYGGDDLVLLASAPGKITPIPTAIGLKKSSWPVIEKYHSVLLCPVHKRSDNKLIRYLPPSGGKTGFCAPSNPIDVTYIVYPHYNLGGPSCMNRISPAQSVCDLATAGFDMHEKLDKACIGQLVDWIKATPSYRLDFNHLEEAVTRLNSL